MTVVAETVLFARKGSVSLPVSDAVSVTVPVTVGEATIETLAIAPAASGPSGQVTVPALFVQLPWLDETETKLIAAGSESASVAPDDAVGPLLVTSAV